MILKTNFQGGSLQDCDLSGAILQNARFEGVTMFGANFSNANLQKCEFYLVLGMDAIFNHASMQEAKFWGGNFENVSFLGADLTDALFLEDNMGGFVDLSGAIFTDAKLDGVVFNSAVYSDTTKFPIEFSPELAGLKLKINHEI